jgi:ABC-type transport system involved in multi-copper enzyme maturation permease subunit
MWQVCLFEIKYRLKHISPYVFTVILSAIGVLMLIFNYELFDKTPITEGEKTVVNSFVELYYFWSQVFILMIFMLAAFIAQMFKKDLEGRFYELLFSKPIKKYQYVLGGFLGNVIVMFGVFIVSLLVYTITMYLPGVDKEKVIAGNLAAYIYPVFVKTLPNLFIFGGLFVAAVLFTRRTAYVFVMGFVILILVFVSDMFIAKKGFEIVGVLLDPMGSFATMLEILGWSSHELYTRVIIITPLILLNRVFWLGLSAVLLFLGYKRFDREFILKAKKEEGKLTNS